MLSDVNWIEDMWADARQDASKETGIGFSIFPESCDWNISDVLSPDFFPDF